MQPLPAWHRLFSEWGPLAGRKAHSRAGFLSGSSSILAMAWVHIVLQVLLKLYCRSWRSSAYAVQLAFAMEQVGSSI